MDKFEAIAAESTIAVAILCNEDVSDVELLPVRPRSYSDGEISRLSAQWASRGLRFLGAAGIVDGKPRTALVEPLDAQRVHALSEAFVAYCETLLSGYIEERQAGDEIAWCERLYALNDPRPN